MNDLIFELSPGLKLNGTEYIYHYTSWNTAKKFIIGGNKTIRFGSVHHMNDPLEFQGIKLPLYGPFPEEIIPRIFKQIETANRNHVSLFCGTKDVAARRLGKSDFPQVPATRGFTHPPMWYHYGDRHEGVCIILSKVHLHASILKNFENNGKIMYGNINYVHASQGFSKLGGLIKPVHGMEKWSDKQLNEYLVNIMTNNQAHFFFTKQSSWAYENEYRWVHKGLNDEITDIPVEDSIAGLILGSDFNALEHKDVRDLCGNLGIPVKRIWWNNGTASPLWDLEAFEGGFDMGTHLESQAMIRRKRRNR